MNKLVHENDMITKKKIFKRLNSDFFEFFYLYVDKDLRLRQQFFSCYMCQQHWENVFDTVFDDFDFG